MITSFEIFYDVEDPNQFCADIKNILKPDGVWVCELSYLPLMLKNLTFDSPGSNEKIRFCSGYLNLV